MITKPIYVSTEHEVLIETYLDTLYKNIKDISSKEKYNDFVDMSNYIIEYHNVYSDTAASGNWSDFMMILPLHFACMVNGYLLGIETKENANRVRIYKELLGQFSTKIIKDLYTIKPIHE